MLKYLTLLSTTLVLITTCKLAVAESSNTDVKLTPQAKTLLCKEFPLNSRCSSITTSAKTTVSPQQTTSPGNRAPGGTTPADGSTTSNQPVTTPGGSVRNGTTATGKNPPGNPNTTQPGSTTSPVGLPPSPGAQTRPYVTPQ